MGRTVKPAVVFWRTDEVGTAENDAKRLKKDQTRRLNVYSAQMNYANGLNTEASSRRLYRPLNLSTAENDVKWHKKTLNVDLTLFSPNWFVPMGWTAKLDGGVRRIDARGYRQKRRQTL